MDAETFYQEFKDALLYLGLSWGDKALAAVRIEGDKLVFEYGARAAVLQLPKKEVQ